ncbi:MAG: Bug family tripartite tricarboxylate transporter substrate binding protein [Burkholderiales bacterium]
MKNAALFSLSIALSSSVWSQGYPAKPVRMVLALGGGAEIAARALGEKLTASMGQPFVVEAMPGAGGAVGAETAARAAPDGYTILLATPNTHVYRPYIVKNMTYDPVKDFTPIAKFTDTISCVVVSFSFPANTLLELIDYAKRNPGKLSYGSTGIGTGHHLNLEHMMQLTGANIVHVPYKGGNQQNQDLLSGQVPAGGAILATVTPLIKAGKLKVLAVTSNNRYRVIPDVPTIAEVIPGFQGLLGWMGYFGPAGLPQPLVTRLHGEISSALTDANLKEKLEAIGFVVDVQPPAVLGEMVKRDLAVAGKLAQRAGVKPE